MKGTSTSKTKMDVSIQSFSKIDSSVMGPEKSLTDALKELERENL